MSKGYILGTVNKRTGKDFSLNPDPKIHLDYQSALTEAKRLLTSNSINNTRKVVILNINSYVSITADPFTVE